MQQDPAGYVDGLNLYEYERSTPTDRLDPLGLFELNPRFAVFTSDWSAIYDPRAQLGLEKWLQVAESRVKVEAPLNCFDDELRITLEIRKGKDYDKTPGTAGGNYGVDGILNAPDNRPWPAIAVAALKDLEHGTIQTNLVGNGLSPSAQWKGNGGPPPKGSDSASATFTLHLDAGKQADAGRDQLWLWESQILDSGGMIKLFGDRSKWKPMPAIMAGYNISWDYTTAGMQRDWNVRFSQAGTAVGADNIKKLTGIDFNQLVNDSTR
jgi:hypothetical protein